MRNRCSIVIALFLIVVTSCNLPVDQTTETATSQPILDTPTSSLVTSTPVPIETLLAVESPTITPTSTPRVSIASPRDQPVNCRFGPGTAYSIVGGLDLGRQAEIVGRNTDSTWWYVKNPNDPSRYCWLAANFTNATGNLEGLPLIDPPVAVVTSITVVVDPPSMNVPCTSFPKYVNVGAEIATNGPTTVLWRWETSAGDFISEDSLLFLEGKAQAVQIYYKLNSADSYWIQVHILSPNDTTGRANFKITCVP